MYRKSFLFFISLLAPLAAPAQEMLEVPGLRAENWDFHPPPPPPPLEWDRSVLASAISPACLSGEAEVLFEREEKPWYAHLTIDSDLQRFIGEQIKNYRADWNGVVVLDVPSGAVLAFAGDAFLPIFRAASVFKIVTSSAAIEQAHLTPSSKIRYEIPGPRHLQLKDMIDMNGGAYADTLQKAFATAINAIFGKIGANSLGGDMIYQYAGQFGFNESIPFDMYVDASTVIFDKNDLFDQAETAAGFGNATLSPLHGAVIASAAANSGTMMKPYLVSDVSDLDCNTVYHASPEPWKTAVSPATAADLREMMNQTVQVGTAKRGFYGWDHDPALKNLEIGGKTGTLLGRDPRGMHLWFVGYARSETRSIAVGVVFVYKANVLGRPSHFAREIFSHAFGS